MYSSKKVTICNLILLWRPILGKHYLWVYLTHIFHYTALQIHAHLSASPWTVTYLIPRAYLAYCLPCSMQLINACDEWMHFQGTVCSVVWRIMGYLIYLEIMAWFSHFSQNSCINVHFCTDGLMFLKPLIANFEIDDGSIRERKYDTQTYRVESNTMINTWKSLFPK